MEPSSPEPRISVLGVGRLSWGTAAKWTAAIVLLLVALGFGRSVSHHLPLLEEWISSHGPRGWVLFVVLTVVLTSVFVPDTLFAVMAGFLFGPVRGTVLMIISVAIAATLNFALSRRWLHHRVRDWLDRQPRLAAIERAVNHEGLRFQLLLRLTPLSPAVLNYMLGATNTRYATFILACVGMIPALFVEVYLGHLAQRVAHAANSHGAHNWTRIGLGAAGLLACLGVIAYVTRIARRAIAAHELAAAAPAPSDTSPLQVQGDSIRE